MDDTCYGTTSLELAGFFMAHPAVKFKGLQSLDGKKKNFLFSPRSRCQKLAADYMSGSAQMSVKRFCDGLRTAKDVLFGSERGELVLR